MGTSSNGYQALGRGPLASVADLLSSLQAHSAIVPPVCVPDESGMCRVGCVCVLWVVCFVCMFCALVLFMFVPCSCGHHANNFVAQKKSKIWKKGGEALGAHDGEGGPLSPFG